VIENSNLDFKPAITQIDIKLAETQQCWNKHHYRYT